MFRLWCSSSPELGWDVPRDHHSTPVGMWLLPRNQGTDLRHRAGIGEPVIDEPSCEATRTGVFSSVGSPNKFG
ncbi:hypothetical protein CEP53_012182 [Fusarium sp. AF-6]|nr:hypothetical protein CEP53_012182 [Fusarium sp. AF-6]